jgi:ABC-type uncharacterized transport system permease subunit
MMVYVAVRWGQLTVNLPVLAIIVLGGVFSVKRLHGPSILLGMFGSIAVAWLWWSLAVPRWRLWALRSGCDPDELQAQGVEAGLLWPKGSFFEKTELPPRNR